MNKLELEIKGTKYIAWLEVDIYKTMDALSGLAQLKVVNYYPRNISNWDISLGNEYQMYIDNAKIMDGYIEYIGLVYQDRSHFLRLVLRDKTADLVDCNWNESVTEWKSQTVLNLLSNLCAPYEISVAYDSEVAGDLSKKIDTFKISEGEYISDAIMRVCNPFDLIPLNYGDGKLTLAKSTSTNKCHDAIDVEANVTNRAAIYSNMDRYSDYIVKGVGIANDNKNNYDDYIRCSGEASDSVISRNRPIVVFDNLTDSGKCLEYAKWIKQNRAGKSRGIKYGVAGWVQTNGVPWQINHVVRVYDPYIEIDKDMLISSVRYIDKGEGRRAEIEVVDKETYTKVLSNIKSEFDS